MLWFALLSTAGMMAVGIYFRTDAFEGKRSYMHTYHAVAQTALTLPALWANPTDIGALSPALVAGGLYMYVAYILLDTALYTEALRKDIVFHHALTAVATVHSLMGPPQVAEIAFRCLSAEASTIFLCMRPWVKEYPLLRAMNDACFAITFGVFRVVLLLPLAAATFVMCGPMSLATGFMVVNVAMNLRWFGMIVRKVQRKLNPADPKPKSPLRDCNHFDSTKTNVKGD